ncbi:hypothetical protein AUP68_00102 [Ilyonectria robusta]
MLFNTLLVNAVLALTSVTAIPNPDVRDANLEDRDAEVILVPLDSEICRSRRRAAGRSSITMVSAGLHFVSVDIQWIAWTYTSA